MEAIERQEIAYSKLARARSKCYKDEGYDENDYVGYLNICDMGINFSNAFLVENILGFQFYHFHFKESMFLLICENKKKDGCGVLRVCHGVFVKTILRKDFVELLLKNFVKKNLGYFKIFIEILWKDVFLDGLLVPNKSSFVISLKNESNSTLLYHLPFKEFLKKFECEEEFGKSWDFKSKQSYIFCDEFLDFISKSSWEKGLTNSVLDSLFTFNLILGMWDKSFQRRVDGMTRDRHENIESFQGSVTRSRARKIDLEMQRNNLRIVGGYKSQIYHRPYHCR
ncbi:hypothetical protein M9H77_13048 [Catharanthus roseus]|uniref:Uncharacterized protein n=1 Tax=Catharanthus roseus TaxID=4058 RepID=A0ACC0BJB8_CATRO|nr:hypothetical protein M9H77_13048 [Catharanthus roseus]